MVAALGIAVDGSYRRQYHPPLKGLRLYMPDGNRAEVQDAASPVEILKGEEGRVPEEGAALCLSGGGYRAMVFHVGVLWRLYDANMLQGL